MKKNYSVLPGVGILLWTAVVLVCTGTEFVPDQTADTGRVVVRISLPKEEFVEGEPIVLQKKVEGDIFSHLGYIELTDDRGNRRGHVIGRGTGSLDLVRIFGESICGGWPLRLAPGRYEVWVQGVMVEHSDTLEFEVKPATGDNAEALRLLELGLCARLFGPESKKLGVKMGQDRELWRKIVDEYPTSVCAPVALSLLIEGRWVGPRIWTPVEEAISDCKRMLEDYSDFYRAYYYVGEIVRLYREIGKVEEGKAYLRSLIDEHPNPKIVEAANAVLDKWKKDQPKQDNE